MCTRVCPLYVVCVSECQVVVDESGVPIPQGTPQVAKMVLRDASADAAFISRLFPEDAAHYTMVAADGTTVRHTSPHRH